MPAQIFATTILLEKQIKLSQNYYLHLRNWISKSKQDVFLSREYLSVFCRITIHKIRYSKQQSHFLGEYMKNTTNSILKKQQQHPISLKWFDSPSLILNLAGLHLN